MPLPIPAEELPTQAELRELLTYCPLSGALRWRESRGAAKAGDLAGHLNEKGYRKIKLDGRKLYVHRVVWCWHYGEWPAVTIDHINGRPWDNRIFNLREATWVEQSYNQPVKKSNKCGVPGVFFCTKRKKWRAHIQINGVKKQLGSFDSLEEAATVREEKARALMGEFYRET